MTKRRVDKSAATGSTVRLSLLALLFVLPPAVAYVLFYSDFRPSLGANHGELIQPARPIADLDLQTVDGGEFWFSELRNKWTLLYVGESMCDEVCEKNLYKINQVRLTQGKNLGRVSSVYIRPEGFGQSEIDKVRRSYPGIVILMASPQSYSGLVEQLSGAKEASLQTMGRIYIVDPIGNVMMRYQAESDPSGMRKDLTRLLKISQIG